MTSEFNRVDVELSVGLRREGYFDGHDSRLPFELSACQYSRPLNRPRSMAAVLCR
jgi:hypothetical protein